MKTYFTLLLCVTYLNLDAQMPVTDTAAVVREVDSLILVSRSLAAQQKIAEGLLLLEKAHALALQHLGADHPVYANCLFNKGRLYLFMNRFAEAETLHVAAKTIRQKALGADHPDVAQSLNTLATLYFYTGQYGTAEPLFLQARAIWEKKGLTNQLDYAGCLVNFANLYGQTSRLNEAVALYLDAKKILEANAQYRRHPYYLNCQANLARGYHDLGRYELAEPLYLSVKNQYETEIGEWNPDYAGNLTNLASLYQEMGNFKLAEQCYLKAITIREKVLGKTHPDYAAGLHNLANFYLDFYRYDEAEGLYLESMHIWERAFGKVYPGYFKSLSNLGLLYLYSKRVDAAEPLLLEVADFFKNGTYDLDYARCLNNLSIVYRLKANYALAEKYYRQADSIMARTLGKENFEFVKQLNNRAILYWAMHRLEDATSLFEQSSHLQHRLLTTACRYLPERDLAFYTRVFANFLDQNISYAQVNPDPESRQSAICFDNCLFYKGFLLNSAVQLRQKLFSDSALTSRHQDLQRIQRRLALLYANPRAERDDLARLEEEANSIEKELTHSATGYDEALRQVRWQDVQAALKPGEAAIEFVRYRYFSPERTGSPESSGYAALVLLAGDPDSLAPHFVPLCEEKQLTAMFHQPLAPRQKDVALLYRSERSRGIDPTSKTWATSYKKLLWTPLAPLLEGVKTVYYSPAGLLHRLNLGAVAVSEQELIADRYELVCLGSTRQLVVPNAPLTGPATATVYGGISFDLDSAAISAANTAWNTTEPILRGQNDLQLTDSTLRGERWNYLKWTEKEAVDIASILTNASVSVTLLRGYDATEESFKHLAKSGTSGASPRIIHLSTHGYFFPDSKEDTLENERWMAAGSSPAFKTSDNPMIRSGLILAGANHIWGGGKPFQPGMEDGILTAFEISQMNLTATELVVLSACETGLGDIEGNEGVYGLQRAFKIAGVRSVIMSLWQVPDLQTQQLMTTFYRNWLNSGMPVRQAFQSAQQAMRARGLDPYYWAGFVLME